ncbi:DUF1150 family protein [Rhodobacteraceae bacterium NNCM2]|nr:DUF1150 family protein [Coraliihabitans acroporae]
MMKSQIVYIRQADESQLPDQVRNQIRGTKQKMFALHDAESGQQLALTADRKLAFALAVKNDLTPISVH